MTEFMILLEQPLFSFIPLLKEEEEESPVPKGPLDIPEILSKILAFLDLRELKNVRQVSITWKYLADHHISKCARTYLDWSHRRMQNPPAHLHSHVKMEFVSFESCLYSQCVTKLFKQCGHKVTTLILQNIFGIIGMERNLGFHRCLDFIRNILKTTRNLDTLRVDLCLEFRSSIGQQWWLDDPKLKLPCLSRLELVRLDAFDKEEGEQDQGTLIMWMRQLFRLACNISTLVFLGSWENMTKSCETLLCGESAEDLLPKLECVEIYGGGKSLFAILLNLKINLKTIDFGFLVGSYCRVDGEEYNQAEEVYGILRRHKDTLEVLKLAVAVDKYDAVWGFPRLPKLTELELRWDIGDKVKQNEPNNTLLPMADLFKSQTNLKTTLPQLSKLKLNFSGCNDGELVAFYESVFPLRHIGISFPQIQALQLTYPKGTGKYRILSRKLLKLFPNVDDEHAAWARQRTLSI